MDKTRNAGQQALTIAQQTIKLLAKWVGLDFAKTVTSGNADAIDRAKRLLSWTGNAEPNLLKLLFDRVSLSDQEHTSQQSIEHYWMPIEITDEQPSVPYPVAGIPNPEQLEQLKASIRQTLKSLNDQDWENLSFLMLILEKFGSFISLGEVDVALVDLVRSTAAVAEALADYPAASQLTLIAGDLSGIQDFIYTISSDGALKSLRARSFYLELVTEEIVQQLLIQLKLPRTNVIYAGGGNLYMLAPSTEKTWQAIEQVQKEFNNWFLEEFQGKIFLALSYHELPTEDVGNARLSNHWQEVIKKQSQQKLRKFSHQVTQLLAARESYDPCKICHRDDVVPDKLKPLNRDEPNSVSACPQCRHLFQLGGHLPRTKVIVRSYEKLAEGYCIPLNLASNPIYYHLFNRDEVNLKTVATENRTVLFVNNWKTENYQVGNVVLLLLGNYGQRGADPHLFISAAEMAKRAKGIDRVGYLRMDVDRLGQIFAKGLGDYQTLPRLAGLSRQMSYFFKIYLNSLAADRQTNLHNYPGQFKSLSNTARPNLLFIYAGGDDLFVSGAWNEITEFALDIYQSFRHYTGNHPEITLSGGIAIAGEKYPLYQAANDSGEAESNAKGNGKDSLGIFGEVFKWHEWLGDFEQSQLNDSDDHYLNEEPKPELFGVLPFVQTLNTQLDINQSRGFIRNLLLTAQLQSQLVKRAKEKQPDQAQAIRYYLHLPKVAYTLARLPQKVREHPDFIPVRTALKNPRNAPYFRAIATWLELLNRNSSNPESYDSQSS